MIKRQSITLLALDIDGVLTDGHVTCSADGTEQKSLYMHDVDAISRAKRLGLQLALVTGEDSPWVDFVARRLAIGHVSRGAKDKLVALSQVAESLGIGLNGTCYVADADRDAPALAAAGLGLAPCDASDGAKRAATQVLRHPGGRGAVAEAVDLITGRCPLATDRTRPEAPQSDAQTTAEIRRTIHLSAAVLKEVAKALAPSITAASGLIYGTLASGAKLLVFGNGGSAADAEHLAAEFVGHFERHRPGLPAISLTANTPVLTAVGNDFGQEQVFARQLETLAKPGDLAVAISTSGRSPNVVAAARRGRSLGLKVVALTGGDGGELDDLADVAIRVPSHSVPRIQEAHGVVIHALCGIVEARFVADGWQPWS